MRYKKLDKQTVAAMPSLRLGIAAVCASLLLSGCVTSDQSDLHQYVSQVKARPAVKVPPLPMFKAYETFAYAAAGMQDPFKKFEDLELSGDQTAGAAQPHAPSSDRNRETLENYPLDTLKYVGQLERNNENWAIVTSPDSIVHRVKTSNYMGQNHGQVIEIQEERILIKEVIPDGLGGWIERDAALSLME